MKKIGTCAPYGGRYAVLKKAVFIMKITLFIIIAATFNLLAKGTYSQTAKVSLHFNNITIKQALKEIEKSSEFYFLYNDNLVNVDRKVDIEVDNQQINTILDQLFDTKEIKYEVYDRQIVISPVEMPLPQESQKKISGRVTDEKGINLPGVSVVVKGTTLGVITDGSGNFTMDIPKNSTLQFSFVGMKTQEILVGNKTTINVTLADEIVGIEEVVAVGYGTQKKINLTGSIGSVNVAEMSSSRPAINVSSILAGATAGLYVNGSNQKPEKEGDATILIRGVGTLNNSSPLVIVDGVESSLGNVIAQDIESVSILKDAASSSIYGSRAANGVILVTTKRGKTGEIKIDYNGYVSFESVDKSNINFLYNYADYMSTMNDVYKASKLTPPYSELMINAWRDDNGKNPLLYPNTNMADVLQTSLATQHNFSSSGGTDKLRYYASFNYVNNPGVYENSGSERFSLRSSIDANITPWFSMGTQINGYVRTTEPGSPLLDPGNASIYSIFQDYILASSPGTVLRSPDGRYGSSNNTEDGGQNALLYLNSNAGNYGAAQCRGKMYVTINPIRDISITGSYTYERVNTFSDKVTPIFHDKWNFLTNEIRQPASGTSSSSSSSQTDIRKFMDLVLNYKKTVLNDRLDIGFMAGASQEQYTSDYFTASRVQLIDPNLSAIDAATGNMTATGNGTEWAMRSYFGRLNLAWNQKYLFELNLRSDASSRFRPAYREGYFPSASGGWIISQENFMKGAKKWLNQLKIRASYGSLGNNSIGNYDALSTYSTITQTLMGDRSANYVLGIPASVAPAMALTLLASGSARWEKTYVTDIGLDFTTLKNRLSGTIDLFNKYTKDILVRVPAPLVIGYTKVPRLNAGEVSNKGFEITLSWKDRIWKDFSYGITGNVTFVKNKLEKYNGPGNREIRNTIQFWEEGYPINTYYLLPVDRIVSTDTDLAVVQEMIAANPGKNVFPFGTPEKGDLLYKDSNNDGVVDMQDRIPFGNGEAPRFYYGSTITAGYKNIDFQVALQGIGDVKTFIRDNFYTVKVWTGNNLNKYIADRAWTPERAVTGDFSFPRLLTQNDKNIQPSAFWLQNRSYLKIRNIQLGYTLPKRLTNKAKIDRIRFYGSLENFFTFTSYKGIDPETGNLNYPTMRQALIGVNLSF